jgi:hypothetical protein
MMNRLMMAAVLAVAAWTMVAAEQAKPAKGVEKDATVLGFKLHYIEAGSGSFRASVDGGSFRARYHGAGMPAPAERGTLAHFLVERYCLYADDGELRAEVHHAPWPLQQAEAEVEQWGIAPVELEGEPICHYSRRLDVVVWSPERY